jgi:F-type H+-transporting ATPase subunit delta
MEDASALARPYGLAAFKQAQEEGKVREWSEMLRLLTLVMQDATMRGLIANPKVNDGQVAALIIDVAGDGLSETGANLVRVMAENERLAEISGVAAVFEEERDRVEGRSHVEVTSAFALSDAQAKSNRGGRLGDGGRFTHRRRHYPRRRYGYRCFVARPAGSARPDTHVIEALKGFN